VELYVSTNTFAALENLIRLCAIKEIYSPYWSGTSPKSLLKTYGRFKRIVDDKKVTLKRINKKEIIMLDESVQIVAQPLLETNQVADYNFPIMAVELKTDNFSTNVITAGQKGS
jgi:hypothetical protein